jgi:hypothetical protein
MYQLSSWQQLSAYNTNVDIKFSSNELEIVEKYWTSHNESTIKHIRGHHVAKKKDAFAYFHLNERSSAKLSTHVKCL